MTAMENGERRTTSIPPGIAAAATYFFPFIGGLVMLAIEKENRFVRFHAAQSIVFWVCAIPVAVLSWIPFIGNLIGLAFLVAWVFLMYEAWTNKEFEMPFLGALASLTLLGPLLPHDVWRGFGALAGSWIGGSANMVGLQAVFETPPGLFGQMVVVDTVVGYTWIGLLISLASRQEKVDRWLGANGALLEETKGRIEGMDLGGKGSMDLASAAGIAFLGLGVAPLCMGLGNLMPEIQGRVNHFAWGILFVSILGVLFSFTPVRKLKERGGDQVGYAGIYLMLAGVGAQADLSSILGAPFLVLAGVLWISIHAVVLMIAARMLKAPLFFLAVGSTANIGGPASAPLVATIYRADLAPVGLILAVLGNTVGYYMGYLTGEVCRLVGGG